ncbi:MAG: hypothetical protein AAGC74_14445, partial [Verrucomicrobiota bacterium]
ESEGNRFRLYKASFGIGESKHHSASVLGNSPTGGHHAAPFLSAGVLVFEKDANQVPGFVLEANRLCLSRGDFDFGFAENAAHGRFRVVYEFDAPVGEILSVYRVGFAEDFELLILRFSKEDGEDIFPSRIGGDGAKNGTDWFTGCVDLLFAVEMDFVGLCVDDEFLRFGDIGSQEFDFFKAIWTRLNPKDGWKGRHFEAEEAHCLYGEFGSGTYEEGC